MLKNSEAYGSTCLTIKEYITIEYIKALMVHAPLYSNIDTQYAIIEFAKDMAEKTIERV